MWGSVKMYGDFAGFSVCFHRGFMISKSNFKFIHPCVSRSDYRAQLSVLGALYKGRLHLLIYTTLLKHLVEHYSLTATRKDGSSPIRLFNEEHTNTSKKQLFEKPDRESRKRHQKNAMESLFLRPQ